MIKIKRLFMPNIFNCDAKFLNTSLYNCMSVHYNFLLQNIGMENSSFSKISTSFLKIEDENGMDPDPV
ncbi:MAG TPA: hypothetical protein PLU49_08065 [Saprospiraceae bacterium]|nr:hypothetical protein [Saprospiraceae bacterium]